MQGIAAFVMAGRLRAVVAAVGFGMLALLLPPVALLSGAVVALVALRLGPREALYVAGLGILALMALTGFASGQPLLGLVYGVAQWLPPLVLAQVLRRTVSWTVTLQTALLFGAGVVLAIHGLADDPAAMWQGLLDETVRPMFEQGAMSPADVEAALSEAARMMTGAFAASLLLSLTLTLLLARYWQAALYNPGGFRTEFHALRVGRWPAMAVLALLVAGLLTGQSLPVELAIVGLAVYLLQGIALMHALAARLKWHVGWLVGMYVLLLLVLPHVSVLLAAMGLIDSFADIRQRLAAERPGGGE